MENRIDFWINLSPMISSTSIDKFLFFFYKNIGIISKVRELSYDQVKKNYASKPFVEN